MAEKPFSQFPRITAPKASDVLGISRDLGGGYVSEHVELDQLGVQLGFILLRDEKSPGTPGGASTGGAWQTRDLNTERYDTGNDCELAGNVFTLQPGTYEIFVRCPAAQSSETVARLYNVTQGWVELVGSNHWHDLNDVGGMSDCFIHNRFTITVPTQFRIEQYYGNGASQGYGFAVNGSTNEVYTEVILHKTASQTIGEDPRGSMVYLGAFQANVNLITCQGILDPSYKRFVIEIVNLNADANNYGLRAFLMSGGTTIGATNYYWGGVRASGSTVAGLSSGTPVSGWNINLNGGWGNATLSHRLLFDLESASGRANARINWWASLFNSSNVYEDMSGSGCYAALTAYDGIQFSGVTGTLTSGEARVWGIKG